MASIVTPLVTEKLLPAPEPTLTNAELVLSKVSPLPTGPGTRNAVLPRVPWFVLTWSSARPLGSSKVQKETRSAGKGGRVPPAGKFSLLGVPPDSQLAPQFA